MDIREFVSRLHVSKGPDRKGEYLCRCPAHDDRTASLCVGTGDDGRILVKCQAGCDTRDVIRAMGLKMADLYAEGSRKDGAPRVAKAAKPTAPESPPERKEARAKPLGKLVKVYPYTDEHGAVLFEVCRFESPEGKTFRQRHSDPGNPAAKQGYVWNITGVRNVIYRLPEVLEAIRAGRTVYVVEGEKDADTLAAAGFAATTNPGGASKSGASKWLPEHTQLLAGANAVILPDNDEAGINDRRQVARQLGAVCRSVKLLDLTRACPQLPKKGDITDMLQIMGTAEGLKALKALEADTAPMDMAAIRAEAERDAAALQIGSVPGYCVHEGCISSWSDDTPKRLCNFTAIVSEVVTRDDGVSEEIYFNVDGWTAAGERLGSAKIPAKAFRRMDWITEKWDIRASILPGNTATDKVRYVIQTAGAESARRIREYTHTGWRRIGGKWCYLYQGGAIGAEGVTVRLENGMDNYCLDAHYAGGPEEDAILDTQEILGNIPRRISVPMLAFMFLAPLQDALDRAGYPTAFSMFLAGGSGALKSTVSALLLSFFGRFTGLSLPASFSDTANYIRRKAFALKDMVLAVDDYHPEGNAQARRQIENTAQQLARAFGDRAQRGRMMADQSLSEARVPRALALISGEDMPNIRESGLARYYVIQIGKDEIQRGDGLTEMQEKAEAGVFAHAMRRYIEWLAPQMDELPGQLAARFKRLRSEFQKLKLSHSRAAGTIAHLVIGYEMYMRFLIESVQLEDPDGEYFEAEMQQAVKDIISNSRTQSRDSRAERPSRMFLDTIGEMLLTKEGGVGDLMDAGKAAAGKVFLGWSDHEHYYLIPETSYRVVSEFYAKKGEAFPLSARMLFRQMKEDGMLIAGGDGKNTRVKRIDGKNVRALWVPREKIDGAEPVNEQVKIEFTEIDESEIPEEFKDEEGKV